MVIAQAMRITILANHDLPSNHALNLLTESLSGHDLTIFLSDRVGKRLDTRTSGLRDLEFFEQSLFTQLIFPLLNDKNHHLLSFRGLGTRIGKPILVLNRINAGQDFDALRNSKPDLIVSLRYGGILKSEVIAMPNSGVINLHSGLLPEYRGVMPTFRALQAGEVTIGTTLHYITDASIDTGPVIGTTALDVNPDKSYLWHVLNLYPDGCKMLAASIDTISNKGSVDAVKQAAGGNYYSFPTAEELRLFERTNHKLFDVAEILEFASRYIPLSDHVN